VPYHPKPLTEDSLLAAIDLGSNSFHLIVARLQHDELRPVETLGEKVQLAAGLIDGKLTREAMERGLDCLARFGQLLERLEPARIRVVGTNALRQAKNRRKFTDAAEQILGVPVDVVYGREEARLVYLGVAHTLADDELSRLVIDIGGGSTEFIIGKRFEPVRLESLQMGCVSYAQRFFPDGSISKKYFKAAYEQAMLEISHIRKKYHSGHWVEAVGSSGTLQAIETLIRMAGWREEGIDRPSLEKLRKRLLKFDNSSEIDLDGLNSQRRNVITAGVAIASAVFDGLKVETMRTSKGALREGVIYDLVGRLGHEDVRERSINAMVARYGADEANARVVADRVTWLAQAAASAWGLTDNDVELLKWAGFCHEIGAAISQKHFNRHSAYLLLYSDLPGFSQGEQELMSTLVRGHRGKVRAELFADIPEDLREKTSRMVALLRLAVIFKYVEELEELPEFTLAVSPEKLRLSIPEDWSDSHPLTIWELEQARSALAKLGVSLTLS